MAHQVETMAWANQVPWHGLGVEVSDDLTPLQMQEAAGLDWTVSKRPSYTLDAPEWGDDVGLVKRKILSTSFAISDNRVLSHFVVGIISPFKIRTCLSFLNALLKRDT